MNALIFILALLGSVAIPALAIFAAMWMSERNAYRAFRVEVKQNGALIRHQIETMIEPGDFKEGE